MSGLHFLNNQDFSIQRGSKGPILCTNIQGFSLILFYSTQCSHCQSFIPIFKTLPGSIGGCQFGMINVSHNKQCIIMSRETIAPIKEVPYIVLYVHGKPYMRYKGPQDAAEIGRFIVEVSKNVQNNQSFSKDDKRIIKEDTKGIPAYTIGIPLCGPDDKVCYLEFDTAYGKDGASQNRSKQEHQQLPSQAGMGESRR